VREYRAHTTGGPGKGGYYKASPLERAVAQAKLVYRLRLAVVRGLWDDQDLARGETYFQVRSKKCLGLTYLKYHW
jgi:hypothetical protein